jgi:trehalose 6-phosphate synthase/phosphatase
MPHRKKIINVANRLPVTIGDTIEKSSGGLVSALDGAATDRFELMWVGWPGNSDLSLEKQDTLRIQLMDQFNFAPVFLSELEVDQFYHGFSNSSLWPILHTMANYMRYNDKEWATYVEINERFADAVAEHIQEGDRIWVHDYHLMLLPQILRDRFPNIKIGFFFHTPFPSSEVFRCHPRRQELVSGVLGADLVGFHTFGYLRHFRSVALRLMGLESDMDHILHDNSITRLGVFPIGINSGKFEEQLQTEEWATTYKSYQDNWKNRRMILSVERLDYTKGLLHRLESVDQFLNANPDKANELVFIFVSVPSRGAVQEYKSLREQLEGKVGEINGRHATVENSPIHFIHNPVGFTELCALYALADVALVTPLVDGMNLVAKEYVACQDSESAGVLVLSEFAGAANELVNAVTVNPYDIQQVSASIKGALEMPLAERQKRMKYMRQRVLHYNADYWANSFLNALDSVVTQPDEPIEMAVAEQELTKRIENAQRVAFFLDYDGTLREFEDEPHKAYPHDELISLLDDLAKSKNIDVAVISGRKQNDLENWMGHYPFSLIAEHGNTYRMKGTREWKNLSTSTDMRWKTRVNEVLEHYVGSTPGSFVEEKASALVWHYRRSDPEFGQWKAQQLMSEVYDMVSNLPVEIHLGKKIVEVSSIHVNKKAAVQHCIHGVPYDLVLCAGDDQTDEGMFQTNHENLFSIKVGEGDTHANYRIKGPAEMRALLTKLI